MTKQPFNIVHGGPRKLLLRCDIRSIPPWHEALAIRLGGVLDIRPPFPGHRFNKTDALDAALHALHRAVVDEHLAAIESWVQQQAHPADTSDGLVATQVQRFPLREAGATYEYACFLIRRRVVLADVAKGV